MKENKIQKMKKKNFNLNLVSHIPMFSQVIVPFVYSKVSENYQHLTDLIGDGENFSLNFMVGVGLSVCGNLMKMVNDNSGLSEIMRCRGERLVEKGFYSKIRHPIYACQRIISAGFLTMFPTWYNAVLFATHYGLTEKLARQEEKVAKLQFGKKYEEYLEKVPRWIPKIKFNNTKKVV